MKKLGIIDDLYAFPIFHKLKDYINYFELITDSPTKISKMLHEKKLDAAFLSPIDYAKNHNNYHIIPKVCVASEKVSYTISLYFNAGLKNITTVATDLSAISEMVLTKILMMEKYSIVPKFITTKCDITQMLEKADSALIVGNNNLEINPENKIKIDLVDEWFDITGLPYVHGIWVVRDSSLSQNEINSIILSASSPEVNLTQLPTSYLLNSKYDLTEYFSAFSYILDDKNLAGLEEFIRMAYYYDIIEDLPDFKFYGNDNTHPTCN